MASEQTGASSSVERFVGLGKDLVALMRDAALLVLATLLLLFPAKLNDVLVSAGFEEGRVAGFKWKAGLVQTRDALKDAQATITDLNAQLEKTTKALGEMQSRTGDPAFKASVLKIEEENRQLKMASAKVEVAVRSTIASNAPLVEKAQSAVSAGGGWGVVFGSDVSLEAARDEIARASKNGIPGTGVYFRNGYYASLAVVDDRTTAQEYLSTAKKFRSDAYIASMATWCRNPQQRDGFMECQSRP